MLLIGNGIKSNEWFREVRGFLIDLDGVLYTGATAIPGAQEVLRILDERGYPYRFISNSTRRKRSSIADKLHQMGFTIDPSRILTPATVAARMIQQERRSCLLLSTGDVHQEFTEQGINTDDPHAGIVVVADAGDAFTYRALTEAFRLLLSGADLLALEKDRYWKGNEGLMLSAGPFVTALEFASGKKARLIGKPAKEFFLQGVEALHLEPAEVAMIGDDITTDIFGARACGMKGILVRTGKYREEEVQRASVQPDLTIDSIAALTTYLS